LCVLLSACVARGPLIAPNLASEAQRSVDIGSAPFFPQRDYQCGPAALATALGASGADVLPDTLVPLVYIPARHGSLQVEMQAAPRKYGRLTYPLARNLDAILAELNAGRPVLVLHNYGLPFLPRWHYAVVVGYDAGSDSLVLRSGVTRRQMLSAKNFMRAWDNGGRWAMVILRPGELPAMANPVVYFEAAAAFERAARPSDARLAFDAAVQRWPNEAVAWIGRGTAEYRAGALPAAAQDYQAALRIDSSNVGARNNLAMTLLDLGCPDQAREQLEKIRDTELQSPLREAVLDTHHRVTAAAGAGQSRDPLSCPAISN
jgi:tetratricopeptide (TPR) repeat protein